MSSCSAPYFSFSLRAHACSESSVLLFMTLPTLLPVQTFLRLVATFQSTMLRGLMAVAENFSDTAYVSA